jgi:hypothetical protein
MYKLSVPAALFTYLYLSLPARSLDQYVLCTSLTLSRSIMVLDPHLGQNALSNSGTGGLPNQKQSI